MTQFANTLKSICQVFEEKRRELVPTCSVGAAEGRLHALLHQSRVNVRVELQHFFHATSVSWGARQVPRGPAARDTMAVPAGVYRCPHPLAPPIAAPFKEPRPTNPTYVL